MADSQTTSVTTAGPALFTHDGYRLHIFDGEPCMLDTDLGKRLGMAEAKAIRKLIKRQEANLRLLNDSRHDVAKPGHGVPVSMGSLLRRSADRRSNTRGPVGEAYYLNQQQVRWIVIKSEAPEADELLRQILAVFKAWEDGRLVAAGQAAQGPGTAHSATTPTASRQWPTQYSHAHSAFLTAGPPKSIPSGFLEVIRKDNCFTRFPTTLDITVTVTDDHVRVFDVDLGHAIGGECTNMVRPRVREIQSRLRLIGPDPWYEVQAYKQLGHSYKMTSVFLMAHEQAKAIATIMDPESRSEIHYRLDLLYYHIAMGRLSELVYDPDGLMIATALDSRAKRHAQHRTLTPPLRTQPAPPAPQADPFALLMIEQATARAVNPLVAELAEIALMCRSLPDSDAVSALRADLVEIKGLIEGQIAAGKAPDHQGVISRLSGLLGRLKGTTG